MKRSKYIVAWSIVCGFVVVGCNAIIEATPGIPLELHAAEGNGGSDISLPSLEICAMAGEDPSGACTIDGPIEFGTVVPGSETKRHARMDNRGQTNVEIDQVTLEGFAPEFEPAFTVVPKDPLPKTLAPGEALYVEVTLKAPSVKGTFDGRVAVNASVNGMTIPALTMPILLGVSGCSKGTGDCDENAQTACETDLMTSAEHCGYCGKTCIGVFPHATSNCSDGVCEFVGCLPDFYNLDGDLKNGCEYACKKEPGEDLPDDGSTDSNCDGIDGTIANTIFVDVKAGNDTWPGTKDQPVVSLSTAIEKAKSGLKARVYVSEGIYAGPIKLARGISIFGGYSHADGWKHLPKYEAIIEASVQNGKLIAVEGDNITAPTTIDRLTIRTTSTSSVGVSNYAMYCKGCTHLTLTNSSLQAGNGGAGRSGVLATNGDSGKSGGSGSAGSCDGDDGGTGGSAGGSACGMNGGPGGHGGDKTENGNEGGSGTGGTAGGSAGGAGNPGSPGGAGAHGINGAAGSHGGGGSGGLAKDGVWVGWGGGSGQKGSDGHGGGGGGGGGGQTGWNNDKGGGNGGGGGGGGGCGGAGGGGGSAGGGSFGLFLVNSPGARITSNTIKSGSGGNGGNGKPGGYGGIGGSGGAGRTFCTDEVGAGGNGGNGGNGGHGGHGGGGAGGPSYAIYVYGGGIMENGNTLFHGTGGAGGYSPGNAGQMGATGAIKVVP